MKLSTRPVEGSLHQTSHLNHKCIIVYLCSQNLDMHAHASTYTAKLVFHHLAAQSLADWKESVNQS